MGKYVKIPRGLDYLNKKPKRLNWKIVAGPKDCELTSAQEYDLIYDEHDLRIRKLDTESNLERIRKIG